jgi:hypothetical protein
MTEKMLAKLQGERMCLYSCFAKNRPSYRGGEENGCSPLDLHRTGGRQSQKYGYQFLQTYSPLSGELQKTGANTEICIGADTGIFSLEQEMRKRPLHIYRSASERRGAAAHASGSNSGACR